MNAQVLNSQEYSSQMTIALKEIQRREKEGGREFQQRSTQFLKQIQKCEGYSKIYFPVGRIITDFKQWMIQRLQLAKEFSENQQNIQLHHGQDEEYLRKERNACLDIFKLDSKYIEQIQSQLGLINSNLLKDQGKEIEEYQILNEVCTDSYLDYHLFLECLLQIKEKPYILKEYFQKQLQPREFIYHFVLKYSKKKIQHYELLSYIVSEVQTLLQMVRRGNQSMITHIQNDFLIQNDLHLRHLQKAFNFHTVILENFQHVTKLIQDGLKLYIEPIQEKYKSYMLIVLEMQNVTKMKHFHDSKFYSCFNFFLGLIKGMAKKLGEMIEANILRDLKFNNYLIDLANAVWYNIDELKEKINFQIQSIVLEVDPDSKESLQIIQEGERLWTQMIQEQHDLNRSQISLYQPIFEARKELFFADQHRFSYHRDVQKFDLTLPLSAKEFFNIYYSDDDQCFFNMFKKEFLYEIEINPTKYDPPIPKFYKSEECMDLRNIVEHRGGSKKKYNYKHPVEHNKIFYFVPDYADCRQEEFVYFINDKEFMVEIEIFMMGFPYADYFSIRQFNHVIQDPKNHQSTMTFGYYKQQQKFTIFDSILEKQIHESTKKVWSEALQPQMIKAAQEYLQQKDKLRLSRKKDFIQQNQITTVMKEIKSIQSNIKSEIWSKQEELNIFVDQPLFRRDESVQQAIVQTANQNIPKAIKDPKNATIFIMFVLFLLMQFQRVANLQDQ